MDWRTNTCTLKKNGRIIITKIIKILLIIQTKVCRKDESDVHVVRKIVGHSKLNLQTFVWDHGELNPLLVSLIYF